jgi:hypothetical protein
MVDRERLGDLKEADELKAVEALSAGFVAVHLRQARVDGGVGRDESVDVGVAEVAADGVHRGDDRGCHQPGLSEVSNVELDMCSLDPDKWVEGVALAPSEPSAQLGGIQRMGVPGVASEVGHSRELGGRHCIGLERQENVHRCHLAGRQSLAVVAA